MLLVNFKVHAYGTHNVAYVSPFLIRKTKNFKFFGKNRGSTPIDK